MQDIHVARIIETLDPVLNAFEGCDGKWCVFGSAALVLHGYPAGIVSDIDLLATPDAFSVAARRLGLEIFRREPSDRFRSENFAVSKGKWFDTEIMTGLEVKSATGWLPVWPDEIVDVRIGGNIIPVAAIADLKRFLTLFQRPKDIARLASLEKSSGIFILPTF